MNFGTLFLIHLRAERTAMIGWAGGLFLFTLLIGTSYAVIEEDTDQWDQLLESFGGIEDAFGIDSFTTADAYLKGQAVALYPIMLGIYGGLAATKTLSGAQETGRMDHVLARPVTRLRYLFTVAGTLALVELVILIAAGLGAVIGFAAADQPNDVLGKSFLMVLEVLPISLALLSVGVLAGTLFNRRGPANALVMGVVVGGFALDILGKLVDDYDWLEFLTPFGWWGRSDWYNGTLDGLYLAGSFLLMALVMTVAAMRFNSKDL